MSAAGSSFDFLKADAAFATIHGVCVEAERAVAVSSANAALAARRALELSVKWAFASDSGLTVPYQETLSSLIHDDAFRRMLPNGMFPRLRFINSLGNKAAHTARSFRRQEVVESLRNLYDFTRWLAWTYGKLAEKAAYDPDRLPDGQAAEARTQAMQQALAAMEAAWAAERETLKDQLRSAEERASFAETRAETQAMAANAAGAAAETGAAGIDFDSDTIGEFATRKIYIDLALEMAGWELGRNALEEVPVTGMPNPSGDGFVDYVLYADDGKPFMVVEAKRTSIDPTIGKHQAKLYADCLEAQHGVRPLIAYTNGFTTWFWDDDADTGATERTIHGFFTAAELASYLYQKRNRTALTGVTTKDEIANRVYQKKAVQAVCDNLMRGQRKSLLVMATGSGKTRTAVSLVEVLQRHGWIKHILFLADRRELVKQAKVKSFAPLLPNLSLCNLLDSKDDPNARMVFSTYPTMMNAIDTTTREDGLPLFGCGHFDLIIVDEAHRSIYKKYGDIFTYFDAFMVGLTATPKGDIDKNTYEVFELENEVPTFVYELEEAVDENWLVPYQTVEASTRILEDGVTYAELSAEEQAHWEETIEDESVTAFAGTALNKFLFNESTVDIVLEDLMTKGIKVQGGEQIGKTIIFAASTRHADFILARFNALFPNLSGVASVVYNGIKYVDSLIEDLGEKNKNPRIAISVDMLDTGIDIPELVNLVFFKRVRSKAKFWQMIGRGTRLCPDLFGPGIDKTHFVIFDYCGNFEFFRAKKEGHEAKATRSLTESLFSVRAKIAQALQHSEYQTAGLMAHREALVADLHQSVCAIDETRFSVRMRQEFLDRYRQEENWESISDDMLSELGREIAVVLPAAPGDELAKRFDLLMYTIEHAYLENQEFARSQRRVAETAANLEKVGHLPQVKAHAKLIADVQTDEFWAGADTFSFERVREALRGLLNLLETEKTKIYYSNFIDARGEYAEGVFERGGSEYGSYRKKVENYLRDHADDLVVYKLRHNNPLTASDFRHLESVLWEELGTEDDYKVAFGDAPLMRLVAGLVGLDTGAAQALFAGFIDDETLNRDQIEFVELVVDHVAKNGGIEKRVLNEHPFNKHGNLIKLFDGRVDVARGIVSVIDKLNARLSSGS